MEKAAGETPWLRCALRWGFIDSEEERLYASYTQRQKERAVPRMLAIGILLQVFAVLVPGERDLSFAYGSVMAGILFNSLLAGVYAFCRPLRTVLAHVTVVVLWAQLLVGASRRIGDSYNELLGWASIVQYYTAAALPFHPMIQIFYNLVAFVAYIFVQYYNALTCETYVTLDFSYQVHTNTLALYSYIYTLLTSHS